jgi:hypothetical protein
VNHNALSVQVQEPIQYVGLPPKLRSSLTETKDYFQAMDNFFRVFAIRPGERVLMLTDPLLDPRVVDAVTGLARARGASLSQYMAPSTTLPRVPEEVKRWCRRPTSWSPPGFARSKTPSTSRCASLASGGSRLPISATSTCS